uniref:Xaa-Pro dipeptidyl-peptidase-like domain-containing protein n=1 Tax=Moniliophthora roreri TaxID=221103 RepID=A0A0W0FKF2_MONRR
MEKLKIQVNGVNLDAELVPAPHPEGKLAICLHPWSFLGGRTNDPVLESLVRPLQSKNYHIIRYNSRGVGQSSGWPSFTGLKESEDLQAVINWALTNPATPNVSTVVIIGYSHGSIIAGSIPTLPPPVKTSHILISYPVSVRGWLTLFRSSTYAQKLRELLNDSKAELFVIYGDEDEFTSKASYMGWAEELRSVDGAGKLEVKCIEGAGHFWGNRRELRETVEGWVPDLNLLISIIFSMPLPDERPRASVANLIGRFEQQNKKTTPISTAPVIPGRSSSVASNVTGDSAKDLVKEKREWPPKSSTSSTEPPPPITATPFTGKSGPFTSQLSLESSNSRNPSSDVSPPEPTPAPEVPAVIGPTASQNDEQEAVKTPVFPPPKVEKISKSPPPSSFRASSSKAPAKASTRTASNASSTPALRPQHTGTSTTSTSSTRKPAVPRTAPNTPSKSSRTSATSPRPKTPSLRSKTPTSTPSTLRAKTPSNLFAPTAASLARSRNASAEAPTPSKKVALSSASAERLSKPTASSLSKAKSTPPSTITPPRGTSSARGAVAARGTTRGAKPKSISTTPANATAKTADVSKPDPAPVTLDVEEASGADHTNGHVSPPPETHDEHTDDHELHAENHEHDDIAAKPESPVEAEKHEEVAVKETTPSASPLERSPSPKSDHGAEEEGEATPVLETFETKVGDVAGNEKLAPNGTHELAGQVGTDIEDMVNLLESKPRPVSMVNIPDEVNEIPDED